MASVMSRAVGVFFVFCLIGALGVWGCDQTGGPAPTPTGPTVGTAAASGGPPPSSPAGKGNKPPVDVDPVLFAILDEALQDEHHAYFTYRRVLQDFAELQKLTPFTNIVNAEDQHVKAATNLFDKRGWDPLPSTWTLENVPTFGTFIDACRGGADAERANIAMYDRLLADEPPEDVVKVFETLKAASLNNHLPAFEKCVAKAK